MATNWRLRECGHPAEVSATQECEICQEFSGLKSFTERIRQETVLKEKVLKEEAARTKKTRHLPKWDKTKYGKATRILVHYKERLGDLVERCNYVTAVERKAAAPNAPKKRKREDEDEEQASSSDVPPPPKHARSARQLDGYGKADRALRRLEADIAFSQSAVYRARLQQLREPDALEGERRSMGKPAATGEERGKLKRKHEEEEQEDDRPWKSRRLGEATAMPTFIARQEPGPAYRVSCLKGSITSSKVNVTNFATDKGCEPPKSVHFHMDAQQKHISRYEIRNRGHYHRPRVLPDGKVVGKSWQPGRWTARPGEELLDTSGLYQQAENFLWSLSKGKAMVPYVGPDEIANYIRAREMERHLREAEQALNALQRAWRKCAGIAGKLPWVGSFMPRAARRIGALEQARRRWRADGFAGQGYKLPPNSLL